MAVKCEYHVLLDDLRAAETKARQEFTAKVEQLRAGCTHDELTGWLEDHYGSVRLCLRCMDVREKKYNRTYCEVV